MYPDSPYDSENSGSDDEEALTRAQINAIDAYVQHGAGNPYGFNPLRFAQRMREREQSNQPRANISSARPASNANRLHPSINSTSSGGSGSSSSNTNSLTRNNRNAGTTANPNATATTTASSRNTESQAAAGNNDCDLTTKQLQTFMIDQMTKVQEQNDILKQKIETLEKEQESYYIDGAKRLERGFKDINKVMTDMSELKKLFKEVVGIMSGERLRFLDHSDENAIEPTSRVLATPVTAANSGASDSIQERRNEARHVYERDSSIVNNSQRITIKQESLGAFGALPSLSVLRRLHRNEYGGRGTSPLNSVAREGSDNPFEERIHRRYLMEDETNLNAIIEAQRNGQRELENTIRMDQWRDYRINTAVQSVYDVAKEYWEGFPGKPSLVQLERKFGSTWRRSSGQRTLFAKRKCIITKIENILADPKKYDLPEGLTRNQAIKVVENVRLGNNNFKGNICLLSLSQLYEYFSKKKDILSDYALTVKKRGIPRRSILQREREKSLSEITTGNATPENQSQTVDSQIPVQITASGNQRSITSNRLDEEVPTGTTARHPLAFSEATGSSGSPSAGLTQPTGPTGSTSAGLTQPTGPMDLHLPD
ncbi:hypothetical protein C6P45_001784 [Maudiozyma exigua]|uniref:Transcription activator GCR1-like domain-containing protein n=1 Tax=Maudiozyma exigua TaxID=34358 RepID=A0A9P7BCV9_MAUEX|nr:hypothetical protein C6P45_001784 [Kazachstania exigua]